MLLSVSFILIFEKKILKLENEKKNFSEIFWNFFSKFENFLKWFQFLIFQFIFLNFQFDKDVLHLCTDQVELIKQIQKLLDADVQAFKENVDEITKREKETDKNW